MLVVHPFHFNVTYITHLSQSDGAHVSRRVAIEGAPYFGPLATVLRYVHCLFYANLVCLLFASPPHFRRLL
jgi:hypothetical protein